MDLDSDDRAMLAGDHGEAAAMAMRLLVAVGRGQAAPHLIDIESAHIDGCLYHGRAGLDFARRLVRGGGGVRVPTTLNVSSLDLLHPDLYKGDAVTAGLAMELMDSYVQMGCRPTWTCAPYHLEPRPAFGSQIAWGESNAIVFANSVLGARTNRYGDFMDICCAITGRAPLTGLHADEGRRGSLVMHVDLADGLLEDDLTYALIGHVVGRLAGSEIPVLIGLDRRADEERLKALGAAAASSGSIGMVHVVGVTPEALTLEAATGDAPHGVGPVIDERGLETAFRELSRGTGRLGAVSVGTPHMSYESLLRLAAMVEGRRTRLPFYVNTARNTLERAPAQVQLLEAFGATLVTDTCTYITPIMGDIDGDLMTDSAKMAYYAPANLGVTVRLGSLDDCVVSAVQGRVVSSRWDL